MSRVPGRLGRVAIVRGEVAAIKVLLNAVQQAWYLATALSDGGDLSGYASWRDSHAEEHYDWSFQLARFSSRGAGAHYAGLAVDPLAGQGFLAPSGCPPVRSGQCTTSWRTSWGSPRRPCGGPTSPTRPTLGARTLDGRAGRPPADRDLAALLREFDDHGGQLVTMLRRGQGPIFDHPAWMVTSPIADLAVHLEDLREALGAAGDPDAPVTRLGFAVFRNWLRTRIVERGLPALRLSDGAKDRVLGEGPPGATLTAPRPELFALLSGRRSVAQILGADWNGDPGPYLPIISPYPLPQDEVRL